MAQCRGKIDWSVVEEYFTLFNFKELFDELRSKYGND